MVSSGVQNMCDQNIFSLILGAAWLSDKVPLTYTVTLTCPHFCLLIVSTHEARAETAGLVPGNPRVEGCESSGEDFSDIFLASAASRS